MGGLSSCINHNAYILSTPMPVAYSFFRHCVDYENKSYVVSTMTGRTRFPPSEMGTTQHRPIEADLAVAFSDASV